nr:hypothetical protein GCM10020093_045950 [Planobispora longispora]
MLLIDLARTSAAVAADSARLAKIRHLAELLGRVEPGEAEIAIAYLSGELPSGRSVSAGRACATCPIPGSPPPRPWARSTTCSAGSNPRPVRVPRRRARPW